MENKNKYLWFEIWDSTYYGTQLYFDKKHLLVEKEGELTDGYGEGGSIYFNFNTREETIKALKWLLNNETYMNGALMKKQRICDLLKLLEDVYIGKDLYKNFNTNLNWLVENGIKVFEDRPWYSDGNNFQLFENRSLVDYVKEPYEFKELVKDYLARHNRFEEIRKIYGIDTESLEKQTRIKKLIDDLEQLTKNKNQIEEEINKVKKELKELGEKA